MPNYAADVKGNCFSLSLSLCLSVFYARKESLSIEHKMVSEKERWWKGYAAHKMSHTLFARAQEIRHSSIELWRRINAFCYCYYFGRGAIFILHPNYRSTTGNCVQSFFGGGVCAWNIIRGGMRGRKYRDPWGHFASCAAGESSCLIRTSPKSIGPGPPNHFRCSNQK